MSGKEFYFQDEMRFGTRTDLGRVWTACGVRPSGEQRIGYDARLFVGRRQSVAG